MRSMRRFRLSTHACRGTQCCARLRIHKPFGTKNQWNPHFCMNGPAARQRFPRTAFSTKRHRVIVSDRLPIVTGQMCLVRPRRRRRLSRSRRFASSSTAMLTGAKIHARTSACTCVKGAKHQGCASLSAAAAWAHLRRSKKAVAAERESERFRRRTLFTGRGHRSL